METGHRIIIITRVSKAGLPQNLMSVLITKLSLRSSRERVVRIHSIYGQNNLLNCGFRDVHIFTLSRKIWKCAALSRKVWKCGHQKTQFNEFWPQIEWVLYTCSHGLAFKGCRGNSLSVHGVINKLFKSWTTHKALPLIWRDFLRNWMTYNIIAFKHHTSGYPLKFNCTPPSLHMTPLPESTSVSMVIIIILLAID